MELSSEDALRLNVLLANKPLAVRVHEPSMTLYGLLESGEACIRLNPTGDPDRYLKEVRAFLSERVLGSPGGYPLYLQRWTRQGQMRQQSLEQLLLLGDPTAVFAVVCAQGLNEEIARRAWWASQEAENARRMLQTPAIAQSELGTELANYLIEYLPFEVEPEQMICSVAMAVQPGPLGSAARKALWKKAVRKTPYLVGFIVSTADDLPDEQLPRADHGAVTAALAPLAAEGNAVAALMIKLTSDKGQAFLNTLRRIIAKPPNQDVVSITLDAVRNHLQAIRPEGDPDEDYETLEAEALAFTSHDAQTRMCVQAMPEIEQDLQSIRLLSGLGYGVLRPVLRDSTAIGSLMRRKLEPVLSPLDQRIEQLMTSSLRQA